MLNIKQYSFYKKKSSGSRVRQSSRLDTKSTIHRRKNIDKLNFIEIKNFWSAKGSLKKVKRQVTE